MCRSRLFRSRPLKRPGLLAGAGDPGRVGDSVFCRSRLRLLKSSEKPALVREETRTMGASCKTVPPETVRISASVRSNKSGSSTRSVFVRTINAVLDLQEIKDGQMLACLRHNAFIGSNHQQSSIDAAHTCQHILDEIPVTRHIHNTDLLSVWQASTRRNRDRWSSRVPALL